MNTWNDVREGDKVKVRYLPTGEVFETTAHSDRGKASGLLDDVQVLGQYVSVVKSLRSPTLELLEIKRALPTTIGSRITIIDERHNTRERATLVEGKNIFGRPDRCWLYDHGGWDSLGAPVRYSWELLYDAGTEQGDQS